jgi:formamidopyrimidine-DNA glycosylase
VGADAVAPVELTEMPELPDVEGFRRVLADNATGRAIERIDAPDRAMLRNAIPQAFGRALRGHSFEEPARHGKWVLAPAGGPVVLMHFGMTGLLAWAEEGGERHRHDRIVFSCDGGELRYRNMRRFGGIWLARDRNEVGELLGSLGPDAESVDRLGFDALLERRRGGVKAALMDQTLIAGLGNLLVDEILWRAHPRKQGRALGRRHRDALFAAMEETLRDSIPTARVPPAEGWLTQVRDRRDASCPRCGARLRKSTVAGRTTCWCPRCQRLPRAPGG